MASEIQPGHRWVRRNTVIEVRDVHGQWRVLKSYHSTYTARDEIFAYRRLAEVAQRVPGVRLPTLISEDSATHELEREFIPGPTLRALLLTDPHHVRDAWLPTVVALLVEARRTGLTFDSDPSNFIVSGGALVLIDPLMLPVRLAHPNATIFAFGLVKICLVSAWHPLRAATLHGLVHWTFERYAPFAGTTPAALYADLADFIGEVIQWNRRAAPMETAAHRVVRHLAIIPLYRGIRWLARRRARANVR